MNDIETKIKRYESLLNALERHSDIINSDYDANDWQRTIENRLEILNMSKDFDIDFKDVSHYNHINFQVNEDVRVLKWSENAIISWSDDDRQPEAGEYVYVISFPTGPYIFGQHYPQQLFREFFKELVSYNPKYKDTVNKCLYFTKENAKYIHEDFPTILKRYKDRVAEDYKHIRKEKLEAELRELEGE